MKNALLLTLLLWGLGTNTKTHADDTKNYSTEHPLVYEDAWDLWPYVFLNENGDPEGYNVDLLKLIFKELDIPYIIKLKPTEEAEEDLRQGRSDLMLRMDMDLKRDQFGYSRTIVQLFTHSTLAPKDYKLHVQNANDLAGRSIIVHNGSFSHRQLVASQWRGDIQAVGNMKEAVHEVSSKADGIILWNTMSLKWLIHKDRIENLELSPIDMPYGEYRFMSNDRHLLERMDSVHSVLRASNRLQALQRKWFYPERKDNSLLSWIVTLGSTLGIVSLISLIIYLIFRFQERRITRNIRVKNERLSLILKTSQVDFWIYSADNHTFAIVSKDGKRSLEYTAHELSRYYHTEDFQQLTQSLDRMISGEIATATVNLRYTDTDSDKEERYYRVVLSPLSTNAKDKSSLIICTRINMTADYLRKERIQQTLLRYQSVVETAMIDMFYYNADGILYDLNEQACTTLRVSREEMLARNLSVADMTGIPDLQPDRLDSFHATRILDNNLTGRDFPREDSRRYYEIRLFAVRDENGRLEMIYGTGFDMTEVANAYHRQQENILQLEDANNKMRKYVEEIDYVIHVGYIRMARYNPAGHLAFIYKDITHVALTLTQIRALSLVREESRNALLHIFQSMDSLTEAPVNGEVTTTLRRKDGIPLVLQLHFIPVYHADGRVKEYFGMCRDISKIKQAEEELALEAHRVQEAEAVKNAFLHNMSYEIRTPLNSVVGFAELFETEHSSEDEQVFIRQIKESSGKLLKLINDILFLSRIDAGMITINPKPADFAHFFKEKCEATLFSSRRSGVEYHISQPYSRLVADFDLTNFAILLERIIENAAEYTATGSITARYDYIGNQLIVSVEDTGCGFPQPVVDRAFDRFATNSQSEARLGLSIARELVQGMGGSIQMKSAEGKGTTVWFSIPCQATEIERM